MKKYLLLFLISLLYTVGNAQLGNFTLKSANQQLIEDAVSKGLFIIRQSYQLKDTTSATPAYYGWNNQPHFGTTYSLAIKSGEGYYIADMALHPWKYDYKFNEYRDSRQYMPIISKTEYRYLRDSTYTSLSFTDVGCKEIRKELLYEVKDDRFLNEGFQEAVPEGLMKGWLVLAVTDEPLQTFENSMVSLVTYRMELDVDNEAGSYEFTPSTQKQIVGGMYILPQITAIGEVRFLLLGVVCKTDDKWEIVQLSVSGVPDTVTGNLTPVATTNELSEKDSLSLPVSLSEE